VGFDAVYCGRISTFQKSMMPEDGGSMNLSNVGILPQHYTASQPRRPQCGAQWGCLFQSVCSISETTRRNTTRFAV
jgi:hypothetical protein